MTRPAHLVALLAAGTLAGCLPPLDVLGNETDVLEQIGKGAGLEDDRIEDKHPELDPTLTVEEEFEGCTVVLNKSGSVTRLDIVGFEPPESALDGTLFRTRGEALHAMAAAGGAEVIPSMEAVYGFSKPFNDGLMASIELGLQQGVSGVRLGKSAFLERLLARVVAELSQASGARVLHLEDAAVHLGAALALSGKTPALPPHLSGRAGLAAQDFRGAPGRSRPIGFFTWSPELEKIFTQDRFLQNSDNGLAIGGVAALAAVLEPDAALRAEYEALVGAYAGLTNRHASYPLTALFPHVAGTASLDDVGAVEASFWAQHEKPYVCDGVDFAVLPTSRSKDTDFFKERYCAAPPSPGTNLLDVLMGAIRTGAVDLAPGQDAGWYEYQVYALETLLLPERAAESDHLLLTAAYKKKLIETFKSLITQTRETHVKQLESFVKGPPSAEGWKVTVYPQLPVEPFPTFYLRTARGYRFLSSFLEASLGVGFTETRARVYEGGRLSPKPLEAELREMTELFYGLHVLSARSVGLRPEKALLAEELLEYPMEACVQRAKEWLASWQAHPDVLADPRVLVPVGNADGKESVYWAVIGVRVHKSSAGFVEGYEPQVAGGGCTAERFTSHHYYLLSEETVEVRIPTLSPPPTRAELRSLCDEHQTRAAIVEALEAL